MKYIMFFILFSFSVIYLISFICQFGLRGVAFIGLFSIMFLIGYIIKVLVNRKGLKV